jgi:hypothetical protein
MLLAAEKGEPGLISIQEVDGILEPKGAILAGQEAFTKADLQFLLKSCPTLHRASITLSNGTIIPSPIQGPEDIMQADLIAVTGLADARNCFHCPACCHNMKESPGAASGRPWQKSIMRFCSGSI